MVAKMGRNRRVIHRLIVSITALVVFALVASGPGVTAAVAQEPGTIVTGPDGEPRMYLDFRDAELPAVIETIARTTGKNFIYDDRVRGRVTIVSPNTVTLEQAYAVFESVLQVKGFTTVTGPAGVIKVIPIREAKESSIETESGRRASADRDHYITRLIPLSYIDAEAISNTLKPLTSKDASMVAYAPTNTIILTDSSSNIRRLLSILDSIDVETYKEELAVIKIRYADAETLGPQLTEVYGGEVAATTGRRARSRRGQPAVSPATATATKSPIRIITDARTNSLIVLASRARLEDIRTLVAKLDVPVTGEGRINVHYLRNADAAELAETLNALLSGQATRPRTGAAAGSATQQALRAAVSELAEGVTVTADEATNSLVIQASKEALGTLVEVIEKLDVRRPQVLVEALIMEIDVTDAEALGFNGLFRLINGDTQYYVQSATDAATAAIIGSASGGAAPDIEPTDIPFLGRVLKDSLDVDANGNVSGGSLFDALITAAATDNSVNILSSPHILTSDNEEAEIKIGDNIPIVTSRVQSAAGVEVGLSTSQNIERRDIGVTLRVTPQISEGDSVRLQIFQEISAVNEALSNSDTGVGDPSQVGVALSNRKIENVVVVADRETVVIGGLLSDDYKDIITKVPWLGDIPWLGWLFKTTATSLTKKNLLVFLTPQIMRRPEDLERASIEQRDQFRKRSQESLGISEDFEADLGEQDEELGESGKHPALRAIKDLQKRYPLERMQEIENQLAAEKAAEAAAIEAEAMAPRYGVRAAVFSDADLASETLTELLDGGYDGTLVSGESNGVVLFEIHLGPYERLDEAEGVADVVRRAYGLTPAITVIERDGS